MQSKIIASGRFGAGGGEPPQRGVRQGVPEVRKSLRLDARLTQDGSGTAPRSTSTDAIAAALRTFAVAVAKRRLCAMFTAGPQPSLVLPNLAKSCPVNDGRWTPPYFSAPIRVGASDRGSVHRERRPPRVPMRVPLSLPRVATTGPGSASAAKAALLAAGRWLSWGRAGLLAPERGLSA